MSGGKRRGEGRLSVGEIWDDTEVSVGRGREAEGKGVEGEGRRGRYHTEVNGGKGSQMQLVPYQSPCHSISLTCPSSHPVSSPTHLPPH